MAGIVVYPRARILRGHDWVYGTEVHKSFGEPKNGDVVSVKDERGFFLGSAIYNEKSAIVARRFSHRPQGIDADFFVHRLNRALELRKRLAVFSRQACRLVWSESDGLPGVVIDRFCDVIVCQLQTYAMELRKAILLKGLQKIGNFEGIVFRGDSSVRVTEGLSLHKPEIHGNVPQEVFVELQGVRFGVNVLKGQKTGLYLDQVENYQVVAQYARERRVLDCFSNQGGFAFSCLKGGAKEVTIVESAAPSLEMLSKNAQLNKMRVHCIRENAFTFLRSAVRQKRQYDLLILDPPPFTRVRSRVQDALRGYHELHLRAAKLLSKRGILVTFSCSYHISAEIFLDTIRAAFLEARRAAHLIRWLSQSSDHPVMLHMPESRYLKGVILEAIPSLIGKS